MRIALAIVPAWSTQTAPLGIASVAGALLREGHEVKVFDLNVRLWNEFRHLPKDLWDFTNFLMWEEGDQYYQDVLPLIKDKYDAMLAEIVEWQPEAVGLSLFSTSHLSGRYAGQQLKEKIPGLKVMFGGPGADRFTVGLREDFDMKALDVLVSGEGEGTALEVLERWKNKTSLDGCLGTIHQKEDGSLKVEEPRPNLNLNSLPLPYFGDFNFKEYREEKLPLMMSRGCVAKCTFCSETRFWNKFRYREAAHIFSEFENNVVKYGLNDFAVADSLVNGNFRVLKELSDLIIESGRVMIWSGYARIDRRMTPELLFKMKRAGCGHLSYGLETGSQKIMDLMEKHTTVEDAHRVIRDTHRAGIQVHLNIIVGFPGETEEDFQETIEFLRENINYIHVINTGETLSIGMNTPIGVYPEKFGIKTLQDGKIYWEGPRRWVSEDGTNTWEVRQDRLKRLRDFLDQNQQVIWYPKGPNAEQLKNLSTPTFHP